MSRGSEGEDDGEFDEQRIYHRRITPDPEEANASLLQHVADLEDCEITDLPPLYDQIDHIVEKIFTTPPPPSAQAEIAFSYHGYRIELDQGGSVTLMKLTDDPVADE